MLFRQSHNARHTMHAIHATQCTLYTNGSITSVTDPTMLTTNPYFRYGIRRLRGHIRCEAGLRSSFGLQRLQPISRRPLLPIHESIQENGHGEKRGGSSKDEAEIQSQNSRPAREKMIPFFFHSELSTLFLSLSRHCPPFRVFYRFHL